VVREKEPFCVAAAWRRLSTLVKPRDRPHVGRRHQDRLSGVTATGFTDLGCGAPCFFPPLSRRGRGRYSMNSAIACRPTWPITARSASHACGRF